MQDLTRLVKEDIRPALGVTEPGAIAFAAATARRHAPGEIKAARITLNSGMYKNAFTCGIPGSGEVGILHAAALGAVGADPSLGLECLSPVTKEDEAKALALVREGKVSVSLGEISSEIFIEAEVETCQALATVTIKGGHTNVKGITENGRTVYEKEETASEKEEISSVSSYSLAGLVDYAKTVPLDEILFLREAFDMNLALAKEGMESPGASLSKTLPGEGARERAALLSASAIEARVMGLPRPAMSVTGSGAHGIIATLPCSPRRRPMATRKKSC